MRFSPGAIGNAIAWIALCGLALVAILVANRLGFFGLLILGVLTVLVCTLASLNDDVPTWGTEVFKARMSEGGSPEQLASARAERRAFISPFVFYRRCGIGLTVIGATGFAWQTWG